MEKAKRISIMLFIATVMLVSPSQISAQNNNLNLVEEQNNEEISKESQFETATLLQKVASFLAKPLLKALGSISLSDYPGYVSDLGGGDYYVTHDSVDFAEGEIGTVIRKNVLAYGQDIIRPYMQKNQVLAGKVSITIYNGDHEKVADESLNSGITFDYEVPGGYDTEYDGYYIHYSTPNKESWYPRMYYINVNPPCTSCGTDSIELSEQMGEDFSTNKSNNKVMKGNRIYIKQSDSPASINSLIPSESLTMNELYTEFYDRNTKELTNQAKTLSPGTQVKMNDVIEDLSYYKDGGYTELKFNSEYPDQDYHSVYFKGDLSNEYETGDSIELTFNVVKTAEINGNTFVDLDYNLQTGKSGEYPSIDSFVK